MTLRELLRGYRRRHRLLQKQIAGQLGVSREYYARIECGRVIPSLSLLAKMSVELNVEINFTLLPTDGSASRIGKRDYCIVQVGRAKKLLAD